MAVDERLYTRGRSGTGLLLHELIDLIENDEDISATNIAICPPDELPGADTDKDSDLSDEEVVGDFDHLPARILRSQVEMQNPEIDDDHGNPVVQDENHSEEPRPTTSSQTRVRSTKRKRPTERTWKPKMNGLSSSIPELECEYRPVAEDLLKETVKSPIEAFRAYFSEDLLSHIVTETNRYAMQKLVHNLNVTAEEMITFVGIMLMSGYHPLPYRRLYWKQDPDVHSHLVSDAIRRNRFDELISFIHLANNENNDGSDKMYKVRPIFDHLNNSFKQISPGPTISIDESMIPYYGRHGCKQFIRGKPIRFGFKLWVAADPSGYIHHVEPYCGSSTRLPETGLGQGGDVVIGLVDHMKLSKGIRLYFDNLFTSVGLLEELSSRGLGGTGTLRENRCSVSMKLPDKKTWKNKPRGETSTSSSGDILAVRWNDNNVVTVLTNCDNVHPMSKSNRYSRIEKKVISVKVPGPIARYNSNMGGVDLSDQFLASYRNRIRSKKWWWPYFSWTVDVCSTQGWLLYRRLGHDIPLLDFRRQCAIFILKSYGSPPMVAGVRSSLEFTPALEEIRKDRTDHFIEKGESKYRRCKVCGRRTIFVCKKCEVPVHPDECFKIFHDVK
ncbi:piggyBac transposable element-derived protein 3-like [Harmonia axyridis]|uniref:piggyBac transposable element-derived protein 3-like n=1 Tax=Harmonia axyridis TaxID=115357 RepID=UPI001E27862D|nr:piggyBac transposable element-derived protein 3-like [Harmonia axyridis]